VFCFIAISYHRAFAFGERGNDLIEPGLIASASFANLSELCVKRASIDQTASGVYILRQVFGDDDL
jgi:hypothetical protein